MDPQPTRETLLLKIRDRADDAAWGEFVELYTPLIYGFAQRQGLQHADASDITQDTLKSVAGAIERFEYDPERGTFRSWLYTIARNKIRDHIRRSAKNPRGSGSTAVHRMVEESPDPAAEEDWDLDYKRQMFRWAAEKTQHEFTEGVWQAFWKTAVDEQPAADVAASLDMSPGAVYIARHRVIKRLREKILSVTGDPELPSQVA